MPEGEANMGTENQPIESKSFKDVQSRLGDLGGMLDDGNLKPELFDEKHLLEEREKELIAKAKAEGKFEDLNQRLSSIETIAQLGGLTEEQINQEKRRFHEGPDQLTDEAAGELAGIREYYYLEELWRIKKDFADKIASATQGIQNQESELVRATGKERNKTNSETRIREINREAEEMKRITRDQSIPQAERDKASARLIDLNEEQKSLFNNLDNGYFDDNGEFVEFDERGREGRLQHKFEEDPEAFMEEFEELLKFLIETQKQKNFDSDRQQTMALDRAVQTVPVKGTLIHEGQPYDCADIRRKLAERLNAFRSAHNSIFLYQNVSQLGDLTRVMDQLKGETENYLTHDKDIARAFRGLARLLEGSKEEQKLAAAFIKEKVVNDKDGNPIPLLDGEKNSIPYWAIRLAGGLICAQHLAAGVDISLNQSGDFFQNRLFNVPKRAQEYWQKLLHRPQNLELYKALDLRVKGVWEVRLGKKINKMLDDVPEIDEITTKIKTADQKEVKQLEEQKRRLKVQRSLEIRVEFVNLCNRIGIMAKRGGNINPEFDEEMGIFIIKRDTFSLSQIKFGVKGIDVNKELGLDEDSTRQVYLDLADADAVRKLIFDPGGFLDMPTPAALMKLWQVVKHLKGDDRSPWFAGVVGETVKLYKQHKNLLSINSEAKKFMKDAATMDDEEIYSLVKSFGPLINNKDIEKVLKEVIGKTSDEMKARRLGKFIFELILMVATEAAKQAVGDTGIKLPAGKGQTGR